MVVSCGDRLTVVRDFVVGVVCLRRLVKFQVSSRGPGCPRSRCSGKGSFGCV